MKRSAPKEHGASSERVLITGGAGFIGSHLVDFLAARGVRVVIVDNLSTGRIENLSRHDLNDGSVTLLRGDLASVLLELGEGERFDAIYHLAAAVGVKHVLAHPVESIETNVLETIALLRFALTHGPMPNMPAPTLIASSSEVYGKSTKIPFREDDDLVLGPTTAWRWSYACSKAIDEQLAFAYHVKHGLPVVIVRFFNIVGARQLPDYGMVLPSFVKQGLEGKPITVYGDGSQLRTFCNVRDIIPILPRLIIEQAERGRVFNLGSDEPISILELANRVVATLGLRTGVVRIPYDDAYAPGFEDLRMRQPDISRVREATEFNPTTSLRETIIDVAASMRNEASLPSSFQRHPS